MNNHKTAPNIPYIKKYGILAQKQAGYFIFRFLSKAGYFSSEEMTALANIAKKYGNGSLGLTSRLTIEIPYIKQDTISAVIEEAKLKNLHIGGSGTTVRSILTCKGSVCSDGLIDTTSLCLELEKKFLGYPLPGKFKIALFGCPNSYGKAQSNDLAILPIKSIQIDLSRCINCDKCIDFCPDNALRPGESTVVLDYNNCSSCGKCLKVCPVDAIKTTPIHFLVFLGGRLGRKARLATPMTQKFSQEDLFPLVEKVLNFYAQNAKPKERFAEVIGRIGYADVEKTILNS